MTKPASLIKRRFNKNRRRAAKALRHHFEETRNQQMAKKFEYGSLTKDFEDGYYVVRVTTNDGITVVTVAEYYCDADTWNQIGVDFDVWHHHSGYAGAVIEVLYRLDLDKIAASAEAQV